MATLSAKEMTVFVGLLLSLLSTTSRAQTNTHRRVLCGKTLADSLDLVCAGRGFHWNKRSDDGESLLRRERSVSSGSPPTGSVVDECCRRPCSYQTLESYCAADSSHTASSEINLWSLLSEGMSEATPPSFVVTTTPVINTDAPNSPSLEIIRGTSRGQQTGRYIPQFFYVPSGSRPTRTPLVSRV